jgi:hypothetical protein
MAIGSSLLVFGLLWSLLSSVIVNELYGYFYTDQITIAYSQLVGLVLAALGAGLFTYGHATNSKSPPKSQQTVS